MCLASQAGDADSSLAPGLTSGFQGSMNVHQVLVGATVTVFIVHFFPKYLIYAKNNNEQ